MVQKRCGNDVKGGDVGNGGTGGSDVGNGGTGGNDTGVVDAGML